MAKSKRALMMERRRAKREADMAAKRAAGVLAPEFTTGLQDGSLYALPIKEDLVEVLIEASLTAETLAEADMEDLMALPGIGRATASKIVAFFEQ